MCFNRLKKREKPVNRNVQYARKKLEYGFEGYIGVSDFTKNT